MLELENKVRRIQQQKNFESRMYDIRDFLNVKKHLKNKIIYGYMLSPDGDNYLLSNAIALLNKKGFRVSTLKPLGIKQNLELMFSNINSIKTEILVKKLKVIIDKTYLAIAIVRYNNNNEIIMEVQLLDPYNSINVWNLMKEIRDYIKTI